MIISLAKIQAPIAKEMKEFEKKFYSSVSTKVILLDTIMEYIIKRKGKQIRPMFIFLSAGTCGRISESTFHGATLIELLHQATLVHDDVVDDANLRRGFFSLNALWKNKIAVLVGDFLFSRGLLLSLQNKEYDQLELFSMAVKEMSEGELLQMEKSRGLNIAEADYLKIIKQKTASLFASCCAVGAKSAGATNEVVEKMKLFGEHIGMAFQIKDDLFDYGETNIGKPLGIDIKEKKMTLPLINALSRTTEKERRKIIKIVKNESGKGSKINEVVRFVKESGGLDYATSKMNEYQNMATTILNEFPNSEYKNSLNQLVLYCINRIK